MKLALLINEGPYQHQASDSAYLFCQAALKQGHSVARVFFYGDGVANGSRLIEPPHDEHHIVRRWANLAQAHGIDLVLCVAAGLRRGLRADNLAPGFRISGLGQLMEASIAADRVVVFGD